MLNEGLPEKKKSLQVKSDELLNFQYFPCISWRKKGGVVITLLELSSSVAALQTKSISASTEDEEGIYSRIAGVI